MKTLIINGSPRKDGGTVTLINEMKKHLKGEVFIVNTYYAHISPCIDCRHCWTNNECAIKDEMQEVYKLFNEVDNVILASPLYFSQLTGSLLNFCSRFQYYYALRNFHKDNNEISKKKKGVLILVGGGDTKILDGAIRTTNAIFKQINTEIIDNIYSLNTNNIPATDDKEALNKAREVAIKLNNINISKGN